MAEGNEREERLRDVLRRLRREENEEGTERRNGESEREEERATQPRQESHPSVFSLSQSLDNVFDLTPTSPPLTSSSSSTAALSSDTTPSSSSPHIVPSSAHIVPLLSTLSQPSSSVGATNVSSNISHPLPLPSISGHISESHSPSPSSSSSSLSLIPYSTNAPSTTTRSTGFHIVPSSTTSAPPPTSRTVQGPVVDIVSLMENSRQAILESGRREREEAEAAVDNAHRLRATSRLMVVPGETTATNTSQSSDQLSEEDYYTLGRMRRRRSRSCNEDQTVSTIRSLHPLSVTHSQRDAALDTPSTTESEPDQLIPGTKYESKKAQRVPKMKKRVLERQRRDLGQSSSLSETQTQTQTNRDLSGDTADGSSSSDCVISAQTSLSGSEETSSTTVHSSEASQGGDHSSPTERTFGSLEKIKGTSRWGSKPIGIISSSVEDEEGGTDTQMIMDTDSADAVGEAPNEEDISQAELFGNAVQSHDSQDDSPNIPRWILQQQQELQQGQELQEYRQDTEESTTNEPLGGQKRSRLNSSTSSTSSVSPMKPPTKRPVIQHDSSSSSNELVSGPRGLKTTHSTTTVKSPTSSIEALSSSYSSRSTALQSLQSLSSGYMASGSSLQSSSDVLSSFEPPQSSLPCVGPVDSEGETTDIRVEGFTRAKGPSSLNTMTTTSNSNNSNNNGKDTTTSTSGSSINDQSGNEKNGGNGNGKDKHGGRSNKDGGGSDKDGGGSDKDGGGNNTHVEGGGSDAVEERGPRKLGEDSDKKGELESDLTLSSTNDSCIIIHSGTVNDSPQPSHSIETNDNLPLSPEREKEMSSSVDAGSLSVLTSPINDTGLHHLEGYCTDTSTGTQTSFHLQLSPSQSGAESDDVVIVSRSTESTNVTPVLSKSPLQSSDSTVLTRRASHLPEANTDQCSAGTIELIDSSLPHSLPQVICSPPIDNSPSLHSSRSDTGTDSHPPVPVYESLQLSNTDVSHSEISPSIIQSSITPNATPLQPDSSQFTSSGTFDFRLPDIGITSNERNVAIEDMETSDPTNDTQCPEEGEGGRESDVEVLGVSEGGGGGSREPVGRSPGKCLSLRRRRSVSAGEATPNKRPKQNEEAPSTSQKKKANTPATNGDGKREGNRIEERRLEDKGEGEGSLEVVGESNGGNDNHDNNMDTAVQPPPPPPRTTGFILGLVEEERDDGDKFNDSSQFVMPPITGLMNESELSPLEIPLAKANNTGSAPNTSLPLQPPSSLFAGLQHTRTKVTRPDPYEFHDDEGSSSDTPSPFTMPLRRRKHEQLASNSTVDSETPIPTTVGEERDEVIQAERGEEEEEEEEDVVVAATTSTPVSNEQLQPVTSITDSTLISSTPVSTLVATPIAAAPNNSSLMSLSDCFVSPSSCLASHALNNLCLSHPHSPFIRLRYTTTVTTSFIRDEIVDRSTGRVVETHDHIERPSEQRRTVIEVDPLQSLPSSHIVHPFTVQQLPSSGLPLPTSNAVCNESASTSFNMGSDSSSPAGGRGVPHQSLELSTSASPHSPLSTRRYKNTTTSRYRYAQPSSGGSASESSTPNGRARGRGAVPQRTQSFELPMESPTSVTPPTSVSAEQSGFKLAVDQKVVARWKDGSWYAATIREVSPIKVYLEFYDGDHSSVSVQNILPLSILPQGIQVSRVDSDITGSLVDFSIQDSSFRLKLSNDSIIICPLEELVITSETAEMTQQLINKQSYHSKRRRKSNSKSRLLEEQLSQKESVLFNGLIFLVTDQRNSQPTGREEIESIIRGRGGYIMEEFKPNLVIDNRTYCISNSYCRTLKYLTALAVSLPCISYEWIRECMKQVKIVDHKAFSLPAGMSPYSKSLVQWQHRPKGFLRVKVHVMGGKTFKDIWEKIIVLGGGKIISKLPSRKGSSLSSGSDSQLVIVSERSNPPQSLKPSTVVSQEWLVESLLVGNVVSTEPFKRS